MKNLVKESKVKSTTLFVGGESMYETVRVKIVNGSRVTCYTIDRALTIDSLYKHTVSTVSWSELENGSTYDEHEMSKRYDSTEKFENAIKRIQAKLNKQK